MGEVLSPKHVAGSCVVAVKGRIMLEVIPFSVADLMGWKEITNSMPPCFYFEAFCFGSWDSVPILVCYTLVCSASATSCWHLESLCCRLHSTLLVLARWLGCLLAGFAVSVMLSDSASLSK